MRRLFVISMLVLTCVRAANAATITASASAGPFDAPVTDVQGPATMGSLLAQAFGSEGGVSAEAALDIEGNSALGLNGFFSSKAHLGGATFPQVSEGETSWSESITNNSAQTKSYRYSFQLNPITLRLVDFSGTRTADDSTAATAWYRVEVRANDSTVIFESQASLAGGGGGHELNEVGTDLGGEFEADEASISYHFSAFSGTFNVGTAGPGETISVQTRLLANGESYGGNSGGQVSMGDPLDLKGDPGINSMIFEEDDSVGAQPASWSVAKKLYR